jgi:glutathione S-transferase
MKVADIPFEEEVIPLYEPGSAERIRRYSPSGKVPVLIDGDAHIWESLAIIEHLADKFPQKGLWPADQKARSHARTISNEMHGGFAQLRKNCPMNMWLPPKRREFSPEVLADVKRVEELWGDCRKRFGGDGPFLFGKFCGADAMYAPVVARFYNYGIDIGAAARGYMDAMMALPAWKEWRSAALKETWVMQGNEPDWPNMQRMTA